jgi:S1-C subfamily serine protease
MRRTTTCFCLLLAILLVLKVYPESPAGEAGLEENDVIVSAGGHPVASREDVTTALYTAAGSPLDLEVRRGEGTLRLRLRAVRPPQGLGLQVLERTVGLAVEDVRGSLAVRRVTDGSPADRRGLRAGDVILGANGQRTDSAEALGREILRGLDRGGVLLSVQRGRGVYTLDFAL